LRSKIVELKENEPVIRMDLIIAADRNKFIGDE